jgi:Prenyltransferase and squalene oxidase repeat
MKATALTTLAIGLSLAPWYGRVCAQEAAASAANKTSTSLGATTADDTPADVLSADEWKQVDHAVERGLAWLASQQSDDGSFRTLDTGQPAVTSLCMMAFIAHGHVAREGRYGQTLARAIDFVLSCQKENGLVTLLGPDGPKITRRINHEIASCAAYNHAISSLVLSEIYGMSPPDRARRLQAAINKSLAATLEMQRWPKDVSADRGGWRYVDDFDQIDSDLSVTGWELMFLRSARNAGFEVPKERIDEAVAYVRRSFDEREGIFVYSKRRDSRTRSMNGAGILALAHAGFHHSQEARRSGEWLLNHGFEQYNATMPGARSDRYHYGVFVCCQAMYQLGGKYWEQFFPSAVRAVLTNQQSDGSWPVDSQYHDSPYGSAYTTALVVIMLGAPNQLLPIFQR